MVNYASVCVDGQQSVGGIQAHRSTYVLHYGCAGTDVPEDVGGCLGQNDAEKCKHGAVQSFRPSEPGQRNAHMII